MRINILMGGKAGQGPNLLSNILGLALVKRGYYVFVSRDYQSLIRGGHNFNVLTFSDEETWSNDSEIDLIVALDENTINIHKKELKKNGAIIHEKDRNNMYFAGRMFKSLCIDFKVLEDEIKKLKEGFEKNLKEAKEGYEAEEKVVCKVLFNKKDIQYMNGNQGIAEGAIKSGLDVYYAYPMTPATNVMGELAQKQIEKNLLVVELESEIAVMNTAIGSAITGAKAMVGTSGGGFDLMTEALSLAGIAEVPVVIYMASRPGPSTGVATYTGQGDLQLSRHAGHGEFSRLILAPGNSLEAQELTSQAFYLTQKFGVPAILLSDKHLAESFYSFEEKPVITPSKKMVQLGRFNSYEKDEFGCATEEPEKIIRNVDARQKKWKELEKESEKFSQYKVYGKSNSRNVILSWGSTKGAILDAIKDLNIKFVQILYIEPFPSEIKKELFGNLILIENNSTGQLGDVVTEKTGIFIDDKNKILRYDGHPFLADELSQEIQKRISVSFVAETPNERGNF